ncbi:MAG TPA: type II secretion system protein, partial [Sedimentisphaerales bacterium]|nr:type II secretion system protein [Sedimentisphaerales bacterium]
MQAKRGFTLVEILIVVVILGILAAIVIPQFTQASTEAKTNSLCSNLQTLRSQIELYKVQHNDTVPSANFTNQMTFCTDINGNERSFFNGAVYM